MQSKILSLGDVSENCCYNLNKISKLSILFTRGQSEDKKSIKKHAGTRIRTWVTAATTQCPNH